jgi:TonB family protein
MLVQGEVRYPSRALSSLQNPYRSQAVTVLLRITVDAAGHPEGAAILQGVPGPWGFNEAALDVVRRSTYAPAQREGRPVPGTLDVRVVFKRPGT